MTKTALVYDWLIAIGGGEKSLSAIYEEYPSPIYTLIHKEKTLLGTPLENAQIHPSFLQHFPLATRYYRHLLPLYPLAIEQFNLSDYDLILSTSHAVAKGVLTHSQQLHLCYCFTPMRYAWDLTHSYLNTLGPIQRTLARPVLHYLRHWDISTVNRVDHFAAISQYSARRIKKTYGREATVIYPPVDVEEIPYQENKEEFYVTVSRMVPYKRIDLIVEAFAHLPCKRLVVIGDGPERRKITAKAQKNVEIIGHQPDSIVRDYLKRAKGFVFAAEEDFGIAPLEAQAAGTPVIALGKGGALETVIDRKTGIFFDSPTVASLVAAINSFEECTFDPQKVRQNALRFNKKRFCQEFRHFVSQKLEAFYENNHPCRR